MNINKWLDSEIAILKSSSNLTINELTLLLKRTGGSIRWKMDELKLSYKKTLKRLSLADLDFIKEHYPENGASFCAEKLHRSAGVITSVAMRLGVKVKNITNIIEDKYINMTKEMAYVLGLLWADGHLCKRGNSYIVKISNVENDVIDFEKNFYEIGRWTKMYKEKQKSGWQNQAVLSNFDYNFCKFLEENDYLAKFGASADKILSKIPNNLKNYWLLGYLDGDGCIYHKGSQCYVSFTSCKEQNWNFLKKVFNEMGLEFSERKVFSKKKDEIIGSTIIISSFRIYKLLKFFYKNYEKDGIGLSRKYKKFKSIEEYALNSKDRRTLKHIQDASSVST